MVTAVAREGSGGAVAMALRAACSGIGKYKITHTYLYPSPEFRTPPSEKHPS